MASRVLVLDVVPGRRRLRRASDRRRRPAAKPATVTAPVKEAQLTTVTLTRTRSGGWRSRPSRSSERAVPRTRTIGGEIMAPSGAALAITAPVAGTLQAASAVPAAGSAVTRGQTLFRLVPIQPSERDAAVDAQQAVDTADGPARRRGAQGAARRAAGQGRLRQPPALEEAQAELAVAEAELKAARDRVGARRRAAGRRPAASSSRRPETAIVQNVHVREGQAVAAGASLIELVRLATVWVRVPIYAGEAGAIDTAAPAQVLMLGEARRCGRR